MPVNFAGILNKPADSIKKPPLLPPGSYHGYIKSYAYNESREKHTPQLDLQIGFTGPGDGIDPADLDGIDLAKRQLRKTFYLTDDSLWRLTEFMASCGINLHGRLVSECVPDLASAQVLVEVTQGMSQRTNEPFNDVSTIKGVAA